MLRVPREWVKLPGLWWYGVWRCRSCKQMRPVGARVCWQQHHTVLVLRMSKELVIVCPVPWAPTAPLLSSGGQSGIFANNGHWL